MKELERETEKTRLDLVPTDDKTPTCYLYSSDNGFRIKSSIKLSEYNCIQDLVSSNTENQIGFSISGWVRSGIQRIAWQISIITILACTIFMTRTGYQRAAAGEQIKCPNYCCIMFIKVIGVITKHEGREEERILHSRTCDLLEDTDPHEYLLCHDLELALRKGFAPCKSCNVKSVNSEPCTAKCCKYYGWIIEPLTGILHRKGCHFLRIVKVQMYQDLAFICSLHNNEEELVDKALVERKANYMVCNSCFRDIIPKRYKLQPGLLRYYYSGEIEYRLDKVDLCLTPMHSFN